MQFTLTVPHMRGMRQIKAGIIGKGGLVPANRIKAAEHAGGTATSCIRFVVNGYQYTNV
jgi:hypothetical protein